MVVAGSSGHVLACHLYLSTCAHTVVLDTSRRKADAETAAQPPKGGGRLSLNFQVYDYHIPQLNVTECYQRALCL